MTQYFYIDAKGTKRGPCDEQMLKEFAEHGTIKPDTLIETDTGESYAAGEVLATFAKTHAFAMPDVGFTHFLTPALIALIWWLNVADMPHDILTADN
jgi:hypothetical protein